MANRDRTILVHLNVTVPDGDERGPDEVADGLLAALERGLDLPVGELASGNEAPIVCTLAEEV